MGSLAVDDLAEHLTLCSRYVPERRAFEHLTIIDLQHAAGLASGLRGALLTAASNENKLTEQRKVLRDRFRLVPVGHPHERAGLLPFEVLEDNQIESNHRDSVVENAVRKVLCPAAVLSLLGVEENVIADDLGFFIDALDGFPGADFKPAAEELRRIVFSVAQGGLLVEATEYPYLNRFKDVIPTVANDLRPLLDADTEHEDLHYEAVFLKTLACYLARNPHLARTGRFVSSLAEKAPGLDCRTYVASADFTVRTCPEGDSLFASNRRCHFHEPNLDSRTQVLVYFAHVKGATSQLEL